MTAPPPQPDQPSQPSQSRAHGRRGAGRAVALLVVRGAVLLAALALVALFGLAVPVRMHALSMLCTPSSCAPGQVPPGAAEQFAPATYALALVAVEIAFALLHLLVALVIFWRRPNDPMAIFVAFTLVAWGTTFPPTLLALPASGPAWFWPVEAVRFAGAALVTLLFFVFPDGRFRPGWAGALAAIWIGAQVPKYSAPTSMLNPDNWAPLWLAGTSAGFLAVMVALQVYRYLLVSNARQRRQTKWVVLGIACALSGYAALLLLVALAPDATQPGTLGYLSVIGGEAAFVALLPLSIGVAILRDQLYDIDLLINRTLVYGALTVMLTAIYLGVVIALQQILRTLTGQQHGQDALAIVVSTLTVAALFQPLRRRVQRGIDRRFFRRRYNAAKTLASFGHALRDEMDLGQLTQHLVEAVERTMEPAHISLWLAPAPDERSGGLAADGASSDVPSSAWRQ